MLRTVRSAVAVSNAAEGVFGLGARGSRNGLSCVPTSLVRQAGQRQDYAHDHAWFRLDLTSEELAPLPLDDEFASRSRALGRVELVDTDFMLIGVTKKDDSPQEVWSRDVGESLRRLAVTEHYYGSAEGQIWWYDVVSRAGARTDYRSGATVHERRANFAMPREEPIAKCEASFDGRELLYHERVGAGWRARPLPVRGP